MRPALILLLALAGCAATQVVYKPVPVDIPVSVPCHAPAVAVPVWPTDGITDQTPFFQQIRAALAELKLRAGYEEKLQASVKACE